MKTLFILLVAMAFTSAIKSQKNKVDTNYATRAVSAVWMPGGKSLLIAVVKYHKTERRAPFYSKVFNYDLSSKQLTYLFDNGSNLAPSTDGKTIAFLKRDDNKRTDIYFFNTVTKKETVLETDTLRKNSLEWSPDGKYLLYNISHSGIGQYSTIDICVLNIATKQIKQITLSGKNKSYDPNWCPDSKKIVYYLEKGDGHDQIWLTDLNGSFHTNLTNDTTTHNYFPSWIDEETILYTQSPETIMVMNTKDRNKTKVEGINSEQVKYSASAGKLVYITTETDNNVILYDWKRKTKTIILDGTKMPDKF
ncbi:MAG TPA: DPP IV N-terminal domain-containing protein [Chitinophagaceae bacterium]|nr:DPP IV N-terminal domain-containing protein [Chitinophagaceae bacterium]